MRDKWDFTDEWIWSVIVMKDLYNYVVHDIELLSDDMYVLTSKFHW